MEQRKGHLFKLSEWHDVLGYWHATDVSDIAGGSPLWWHIPRLLEMDMVDYVRMLIDEYNVPLDKITYFKDKNVLLFYWKNQGDMRRFKNMVNRIAREKNYLI